MAVSVGQPYDVTVGADPARPYKIALIVLALADILYLIAFALGVFDSVGWFDEDGPIEDMQVVVLAIAAAVSAGWAFRQKREGRIISYFLFAMFVACCWREMDLRGTTAPEWLIWMFHGTGQHVFIAAIFAVFLVTQVRHWAELPRLVIATLQPRSLLYVAAGAVLLSSGIAEIAELHYGMAVENFEEWLELNGYLLFLFAAYVFPYRDLEPGQAAAWVGTD
jgi:hypothetical protein